MDRITAKQASEKWNLSTRTVQDLCVKGRISGAERWGRTWMIPADAEKPADKRTKVAKESSNFAYIHVPRQTPNFIMSSLYSVPGSYAECMEKLSAEPETAALFEAWMSYARGEIQKAVSLAMPLLHVKADFYGTISVGSILIACALWLNDMNLFHIGRAHIAGVACANEKDVEIRDFWLTIADVGVLDHTQYPEWFRKGSFERLPDDSLPLAWFYYARYLHKAARDLARGEMEFSDVQGLGLYRTYPYIAEPLITQVQREGSVLAEIGIRLLCAEAYLNLNERANAIRHLDVAISLAVSDKLYGFLAEFRGLFNHLMDERIVLLDAEAAKDTKELYRKMMSGWTKMTERPIIDSLSDRENEIAQLVSLGMSNHEIAERLQISVHTVKSTVTMIRNKTGEQKRSGFGSHIF
ncbi:helix-turn-helix transcriptional regulator [Anaerotignum sp.]